MIGNGSRQRRPIPWETQRARKEPAGTSGDFGRTRARARLDCKYSRDAGQKLTGLRKQTDRSSRIGKSATDRAFPVRLSYQEWVGPSGTFLWGGVHDFDMESRHRARDARGRFHLRELRDEDDAAPAGA